jgi:PilZ domain
MELIHVYASATDQVTIICPKCGFARNIDVKKFKNAHSKLKARCRCGEVFRVALDFRKYYRKGVKLPGEYTLKGKKERGEILVEDISMTGVRFSTVRPHHISGNDTVELRFTLNNPKKTEIRTPVKIRWIVDHNVGAEFIDLNRFKQDLVFYLTK